MRLGGEPIVSTKDSIALDFKTNRPDGLLFYTGYTTPDDLISLIIFYLDICFYIFMLVRYFFLIHLGDGEDYLNLALKDGGISLSINLGSGTLDTGIGQISSDKKKSVRFDDDQWHHVYIKRVAQEVSLQKIFMTC